MIRMQFHTPQGIIDRELTAQEVLDYGMFPLSEYAGQVTAFDPKAARPVTVSIVWQGYAFSFPCFVTLDLLDAHVGGKLKVGDWILVYFLEGDAKRPIAHQILHKTW